MLIISRQTNQKIVIDGDIEITVLELNESQVKLGLTAPAGLKIVSDDTIDNTGQAALVMAEVAELLLETAAGTYSRQQTRQAMKKVERLMREYGDLKYPSINETAGGNHG